MKPRRDISQQERELFRDAVGPVRRLRDERAPQPPPGRVARPRPAAAPIPQMHGMSEAEAMPLGPGDRVEYRGPGLRHRDLQRLRRGRFTIEARIDLHGLTVARAASALAGFVADSQQRGRRCVLVIHGKGYGAAGGHAVLKAQVTRWLEVRDEVLGLCSALANDGGTGALYVLLRNRQ